MSAWRFHGSCLDGERFLIGGVNVWEHDWQATGEPPAVVADPHHHQAFTFPVYRIVVGDQHIEFAAGEFSNCVWGFYVRETP